MSLWVLILVADKTPFYKGSTRRFDLLGSIGMKNHTWISVAVGALVSGGAFLAANELQEVAISRVDLGVSAPYLPAGVRLIAVAVFGLAGCVGLFLSGLWISAIMFPAADVPALLAIAAVSGFTPLVALLIVRRIFGISDQLRELSFRSLLLFVSLMSVLSPLAHQAVFLVTGAAPASLFNLLAMIAGDVVGCMLVVLVVAAFWRQVEGRGKP